MPGNLHFHRDTPNPESEGLKDGTLKVDNPSYWTALASKMRELGKQCLSMHPSSAEANRVLDLQLQSVYWPVASRFAICRTLPDPAFCAPGVR